MTDHKVYRQNDLIDLKAEHDFFVGIDSDGCVFDTMEIKQKQCFHKNIVSNWKLENIEKYVRESAEFVNLYSKWRGQNRFPCLLMVIDLLRDRPEVMTSGVKLPEFKSLRTFIDSGTALGHPQLEQAVRETGDMELASVLKWSKDVNADIARTVKNVPPFKWVRESLELLKSRAEVIVVSQTPTEALVREWNEHGITSFVRVIAGQELGSKTEHIAMATKSKYPSHKILMIGDALGDLKAARGNNALFFPINPGKETASWDRFYHEAATRFFKGTYAGEYENALIEDFQALLPDVPPWKRVNS